MFALGNTLLSKSKKAKKPRFEDKSLKISERAKTAYSRLDELHSVLHEQENRTPGLLSAFDYSASPSYLTTLGKRITIVSTVPPTHQPPTTPAAVQHRTDSEGQSGEKRKAIAAPGPTQPDTSNIPGVAAVEPDQSQDASGKRQMISAALDLTQTNHPAAEKEKHRKKQRKGNTSTEQKAVANSDPQQAVVSSELEEGTERQEDKEMVTINVEEVDSLPAETVPVNIEDVDSPPEVEPTAWPVKDKRFSTVDGRIVPSDKETIIRAKSDELTDKEQLALYRRFKQVVTAQRIQGVGDYKTNAQQWYELWEEIALILPGRGVINCIEFYVDNEEKFAF
ncbi:hypothetical protein Q7P36_009622 [Cladosporium allicinum]